MATKQKFISRCNELNIVAEDDGQVLTITPPSGKVFATFFTHHEQIHYDYDGWKKSEAYESMIEIMADGLVDCDEQDCEACKD